MGRLGLSRAILFTVTVTFWFAQYAYTPYVNPQLIVMGVTATVMGFIGGAYGLTQFILRIPVGVSADRWQMKFFICAGSLCAGLAALCMLLFHNPTGFLIGRALGGVAASSWVPFSVLYSSYYKPDQATRSMTMINLANQMGRMISFFMAGLFASRFGPQAAFLLSAVGGFIAFGLSLFVHEDKTPSDKASLTIRELLAVGKERNLLITSALTVCVQLVTFATFQTFTMNHAVAIGTAPAQLGYMLVALFLPAIILSFCLSKFILHRMDAKKLVVLGFLVTALYCLLVTFTSTVWQLYLVQVLGGIGNTLTLSLLMGMSVLHIAAEKRGAAMGIFQSVYAIGMTLGPPIMGFLADNMNLRAGFMFMTGIAILSMIASALFLKSTRPFSQ